MRKYKPYVIVCALSSHSVKQFLQFSLMMEQFLAVITCQFCDKKFSSILKRQSSISFFCNKNLNRKVLLFLASIHAADKSFARWHLNGFRREKISFHF